ncbi:MAG: phage protein Gp36 family protein [Pseudomonadota bacterium]
MAYTALQDLIDRFGVQDLRDAAPNGAGDIDPVKVQAAIDDTDGEIDSYLAAGGYAVPLAPIPKLIAGCAADLARLRLYDDDAPKPIAERGEQARRLLRSITAGEIRLSAAALGAPAGGMDFETGRRVMPGGGY